MVAGPGNGAMAAGKLSEFGAREVSLKSPLASPQRFTNCSGKAKHRPAVRRPGKYGEHLQPVGASLLHAGQAADRPRTFLPFARQPRTQCRSLFQVLLTAEHRVLVFVRLRQLPLRRARFQPRERGAARLAGRRPRSVEGDLEVCVVSSSSVYGGRELLQRAPHPFEEFAASDLREIRRRRRLQRPRP